MSTSSWLTLHNRIFQHDRISGGGLSGSTPFYPWGQIDQKRLVDVWCKGFNQAHDFEQTCDSSAGFTFTSHPFTNGEHGDSEILCGLCIIQSESFDSLNNLISDSAGKGLFGQF